MANSIYKKIGKKLTITLSFSLILSVCISLFGSLSMASNDQFEHFKKSDFNENSINIDNKWWPLTPGKELIFEGETVNEEGESIPHKVVFTVTDLTKYINGINTVVIWENDISDGFLEESELAFFAQDKQGNVWHFGQYREMYEINDNDDLELLGGRAWLAGHLKGARAGIMMQADPQEGTPDYSQGFAPAPFNWTDRARVLATGEQTTVPAGSYDNVLVIEEFNEEEPGALQFKYYAQGVGVVRVGFGGTDETQETLELVEIKTLKGQDLIKARRNALKLEDRNYVYGHTFPAKKR